MRLVEVALENFRGYAQRTVLSVDNLTILVGRNDAGKSTFLDALDVVLGGGKMDASDINVRAPVNSYVSIECAFDDLPDSLTLDAGSKTTLKDEYLVDELGRLRLRWMYEIGGDAIDRRLGKQQVRVIALHPGNSELADLHSKKNADLKRMVETAGVAGECELNNNASMRQALWKQACLSNALNCKLTELDLSKEDGKSIFSQIQTALPMFVLFRADRPSTDQDAEVQDPMKVAVRTALEELRSEVDAIKDKVREKALEVAGRTVNSLREFDESLAASLEPVFADPKIESAFRLTLLGDDGIAVNKRGSGVRRLVLFSFFRAEVERRQLDSGGRGVIYAIEEPETAQHPNFQRRVINTLWQLSETDGYQVIATTHSPGLAGLVPSDALRLVSNDGTNRKVAVGDDALLEAVRTLGVVPDHRVRVLVCVEGPHDRAFLIAACKAYRASGEDFVCLETDPSIAFVLLGGSTLAEWVSGHLLRNINIPEFHIYDGDVEKYGEVVEEVNARGGNHSARQTFKRELENYLCPTVTQQVLAQAGVTVRPFTFSDEDDVESVVAAAVPDAQGNPRKRLARRSLKHWLNYDVATAMTAEDFTVRDQRREIRSWLEEITRIARAIDA